MLVCEPRRFAKIFCVPTAAKTRHVGLFRNASSFAAAKSFLVSSSVHTMPDEQTPLTGESPTGSIPSGYKGSGGGSRNTCLCLVALLGGLGLVLLTRSAPAPSIMAADESWPKTLAKIDQAITPLVDNILFTTTEGAAADGWAKSDEPCDPLLGQSWLYGGERSAKYSAAIYFTPETKDSPGLLSAIETDIYGYVEENLVGLFFTQEKTSKDGAYHSISIALRNGEDEDLCAPVALGGNPPYVVISPGMANMPVPLTEDDPELVRSEWQRGSCIPNMGYHWSRFLSPVTEMPYKTSELVPVTPMYSSRDGSLNGVFVMASSRQQTWPAQCDVNKGPTDPCPFLSGELNMWDSSPGLNEDTCTRFYMCSNFCGDCRFTGTEAGRATTMHFFFKQTAFFTPDAEVCFDDGNKPFPNGQRPYCPNGDYPKRLPIEECVIGP